MVGAHLDSVPEGPGINDNGSGVAAVLETALQLGSSPEVNNAVRFGFWGAEELGLLGSNNYVQSLNVEALKDIALYLNFDMLASPNPGYFTYDGDQSAPPDPDHGVPRIPEGSAGIERTLVAYLKGAGKPAEDIHFDGRSDYDGFTRAGVPAGGIFSGAEEQDVGRAGQAVGRTGRRAVRSQLPQGNPTRWNTSIARRWTSTAAGSRTSSASMRRIRAAATVCRSATTAPDMFSSHDAEMGGRGRRHRGADVVFVHAGR